MGIYVADRADAFHPVADQHSIPKATVPASGAYALTRNERGQVAARSLGAHYGEHTITVSGWQAGESGYTYTAEDGNVNGMSQLHAYPISDADWQASQALGGYIQTFDGGFILTAQEPPSADIHIRYECLSIDTSNLLPPFTYTGGYTAHESVNPKTGRPRAYIRLLSDGALSFGKATTVDGFVCGGGGASSALSNSSGGGGGYTNNVFGLEVDESTQISITIGQGGAIGAPGGATTMAFSNGLDDLAAAGGQPGTSAKGGDGGSGGGGHSGGTGGRGGSGGSDGGAGGTRGGKGQGFTTRPFLGDVSPFSDDQTMLFGAGAGGTGVDGGGPGGVYGGGSSVGGGTAGRANTGAGGGKASNLNTTYAHKGGAGIAIVRYGDWTN